MATHTTTVVLKAKDETGRAFKTAERGMTTLDKSAVSLSGALRVVGGLLAATGALSIIKGALGSADALAKTSSRLGVTIERLQELDFAASQSGVAFTTVTMGMQRFGRRLAEAAAGGGAAKDALVELNIETRNADGSIRDVNEAFTEAVNKLGRMESGAKKTSLAFKLFDSEGVRLVQFGSNLDALSEEANSLGLVLDSALIKKAEEVNDAFDKAARTMQTEFKRAVLENADALTLLGKGGVFAASALGTLLQSAITFSRVDPLKAYERLTDQGPIVKGTEDIASQLDLAGKFAARMAGELASLDTPLDQAVAQAKAFAQAFDFASDRSATIASNLAGIQGIGEERGPKRPATVLGALTKSSQARAELSRGNVQRASELALQAAEELRAVEQETGKSVTLAGTFIKNFEKIAQAALDKAEEQKEALKLVIVIDGQPQTFDLTKEGVKKAGDATTKRLKLAEKKRA